MMWLPFSRVYGPEWQAALDAIKPTPERFDAHVRAMDRALARDPVGWTEGFLARRDALRIFRTQDFANGYEIVVLVLIDRRKHSCERKWIEVRELANDEDPDPGPEGMT